MTREDPQMKLRLPVDLKDRLTALAEENGRSLNAEVVRRLEESLEGELGGKRTAPVDDRTLDLFAETVAGKVVQALDEREKKRAKR
ncbi:Arc family DNA-binding protein [Paraburkholderia heleia]|uniref:Arc family DNA-binding protein n=1 Tax=Paraburkholderia heleia TaxID=634127 RepID=UPI002AB7C3C0|nr:Arc family DNA-binding protein [Paraburkholderia heleia]